MKKERARVDPCASAGATWRIFYFPFLNWEGKEKGCVQG